MKSLEYFHRVKKNPVDTKYGIGIIPYVYNDAKDYYYKMYLAQHANDDKDLSQYIPQDEVIHIKPPKKQPTRRKLFTFLEKEVCGMLNKADFLTNMLPRGKDVLRALFG